MGLIVELLQEEPIVWIRTQLEGQAPEASKSYGERKKAGQLSPGEKAPKTYRGQKAFSENGKITGKVTDPATGEVVVGRPAIQDSSRKVNNPASPVPSPKGPSPVSGIGSYHATC